MLDLSDGSSSLIAIAVAILALFIALWLWFLVNRASVRANEQVRLLQEIAEQQRQQTMLLKRLAQNGRSEKASFDDEDDHNPVLRYKGFIPER